MKPEEFTVDAARGVMNLWKKHLGFWHRSNLYMEHPELLADRLQKPSEWFGSFQDRVGSRYTDDSKLLASLEDGELEISCYAQAQNAFRKDKKKAEMAEKNFNREVMDYIRAIG